MFQRNDDVGCGGMDGARVAGRRRAAGISPAVSAVLAGLVGLGLEVGRARAEEVEPCALDLMCVLAGQCTRVGEACGIGSEADCLQSEACQGDGRCSYAPSDPQKCVARADCDKTPACKAFGVCELVAGECSHTWEGCAASRWCVESGRCLASSGPSAGCVPESCIGAEVCVEDGACEVVRTDDDAFCAVTTTKACMESRGCTRFGRCQKDPAAARCRITEGGCKRSAECREMGRCAVGAGERCVPDGPGCAASEVCKQRAACHIWGDVCVSEGEGMGVACEAGALIELRGLEVSASSEHKPTPPYRFEARHLVDRDLRTSWQPASKKGGVGEKIIVRLPRPMRVSRLELANGFQLRDRLGDLWHMNNRATRVLVRTADLVVAVTLLADRLGFEAVTLPPVLTERVEIEILGVDRGSRWNDLALSELRLYGCP